MVIEDYYYVQDDWSHLYTHHYIVTYKNQTFTVRDRKHLTEEEVFRRVENYFLPRDTKAA